MSENNQLAALPKSDVKIENEQFSLAHQRENDSLFEINYFPGVSLGFADSLADELWAASAI